MAAVFAGYSVDRPWRIKIKQTKRKRNTLRQERRLPQRQKFYIDDAISVRNLPRSSDWNI